MPQLTRAASSCVHSCGSASPLRKKKKSIKKHRRDRYPLSLPALWPLLTPVGPGLSGPLVPPGLPRQAHENSFITLQVQFRVPEEETAQVSSALQSRWAEASGFCQGPKPTGSNNRKGMCESVAQVCPPTPGTEPGQRVKCMQNNGSYPCFS